jgi:hypothetical protein
MWLLIVGLLGVGLGVLALIGLLGVAKELFCDRSPDANFRDAGTTGPYDVGGRASARCVMPR